MILELEMAQREKDEMTTVRSAALKERVAIRLSRMTVTWSWIQLARPRFALTPEWPRAQVWKHERAIGDRRRIAGLVVPRLKVGSRVRDEVGVQERLVADLVIGVVRHVL